MRAPLQDFRFSRAVSVTAALLLHAMVAIALLAAPPRSLRPAPDLPAVDVVMAERHAPDIAVADPPRPAQEMPPVGGVDLQEAVIAGPVVWPDTAPPAVARPRPPAPPRRTPAAAAPARPDIAAGTQLAAPRSDEVAAWRAALAAWIERHRRYPSSARFRQEEGVVRVSFDLDPSGRVQRVALESGSGSPSLDAAALALLAGASLPAPPAGMDPALRSVSLAIRYRLE